MTSETTYFNFVSPGAVFWFKNSVGDELNRLRCQEDSMRASEQEILCYRK